MTVDTLDLLYLGIISKMIRSRSRKSWTVEVEGSTQTFSRDNVSSRSGRRRTWVNREGKHSNPLDFWDFLIVLTADGRLGSLAWIHGWGIWSPEHERTAGWMWGPNLSRFPHWPTLHGPCSPGVLQTQGLGNWSHDRSLWTSLHPHGYWWIHEAILQREVWGPGFYAVGVGWAPLSGHNPAIPSISTLWLVKPFLSFFNFPWGQRSTASKF